jgi:hypothetical protein
MRSKSAANIKRLDPLDNSGSDANDTTNKSNLRNRKKLDLISKKGRPPLPNVKTTEKRVSSPTKIDYLTEIREKR